MEIKDNRVSDHIILFQDLAYGACFEFESKLYIVTNGTITADDYPKNAICLNDGTAKWFHNNEKCIVVSATIEINK